MKAAIDHVINSAIKKPTDEINVLYFGYNDIYSYIFNPDNTKFYTTVESCLYPPKIDFGYRYTVLPHGMQFIPNRIDLDVIICNSRKTQVNISNKLSEYYHIPTVLMEHELPSDASEVKMRNYVNSHLPTNMDIIVPHEIVKEEWGLDRARVIPYGIPVFNRNLTINKVLVVGNYNNNNQDLLNKMLSCDTNVVGLGYNIGTTPYEQFSDIIKAMTESLICVCASNERTPPLFQLLAMGCGNIVVTNRTRWTEAIIEDGRTGFLFERSKDIKNIVKSIKNDCEVGFNAVNSIMQNNNIDNINTIWYEYLYDVSKRIYKK